MKRLKIILLLVLMATSAFGQFYVQPMAGYSFSSYPEEMRSTAIINSQKSVYTMNIRFGEGVNAGLTFGYCLWDNLFVELNTGMAIYGRHTASVPLPDIGSDDSFSLSGIFGDVECRGPVFRFAPRVGYSIQKDKFSASFSLGPDFMKSKIRETIKMVIYDYNSEIGNYPREALLKYKYTGGLHMGMQADLGFCYSVSPKMQFVLDFVTVYNNYKITKGEITCYEIDGINQIDDQEDTDIYINRDSDTINHSYFGVNVGLRFPISSQLLQKK